MCDMTITTYFELHFLKIDKKLFVNIKTVAWKAAGDMHLFKES